jgi:3',5'-nucleoside bisphosphate phosphatase
MVQIKFLLLLTLVSSLFFTARAQSQDGVMRMDEFRSINKRALIVIPKVNNFDVLKCDFHMHTVFSDGHVWPNVRIQEAWREGLDVISITDHIEYTPHSDDVPVNHNRAYELAKDHANEMNIGLIKGTEITRRTPPGHFNAIFIGDASKYTEERENNDKDKEAVLKAIEQNAFVFWNHPGWKEKQIEGSYEWIDFVDDLYKNGHLHGIEVFNGFYFHKKALDWCIDKNLTVLGTSDIHNLVAHDYNLNGYINRSMTLVFAKDKSEASIREALDAGRTVAWSSKYLAGTRENVEALVNACIQVSSSYHSKSKKDKQGNETTSKHFEITNNSDLYFELQLETGKATEKIILYPQSTQRIIADADQSELIYEVVNTFIRSDKHSLFTIKL